MIFLLIPSIVSCCNAPEVEGEEEEKGGKAGEKVKEGEKVEMGDKDQIGGVRVSDVDIETKM